MADLRGIVNKIDDGLSEAQGLVGLLQWVAAARQHVEVTCDGLEQRGLVVVHREVERRLRAARAAISPLVAASTTG